ncbi:uncharacterized protein C8Q71DRAFT_180401 [Rhodofomes roseus]|uniref:Uncharacterized protein n=1 Tax=Rhodofomes roseus TaxID=34475 RepID=A0ABQ8K8U6_9APHY|nr:uncharacterized protein C8Q71DRAFT_180401 [Rhodofomes roseus]KAH9833380.1 hypothetical protein C8Q71DRAFT_180401 [Rhodofomes roseus]
MSREAAGAGATTSRGMTVKDADEHAHFLSIWSRNTLESRSNAPSHHAHTRRGPTPTAALVLAAIPAVLNERRRRPRRWVEDARLVSNILCAFSEFPAREYLRFGDRYVQSTSLRQSRYSIRFVLDPTVPRWQALSLRDLPVRPHITALGSGLQWICVRTSPSSEDASLPCSVVTATQIRLSHSSSDPQGNLSINAIRRLILLGRLAPAPEDLLDLPDK